jgi:transglutaminase-like putative cysteine protease
MTPRVLSGCALLGACLLLPGPAARPAEGRPQVRPRSRTFTFTYAGAVTGLTPGQQARVWLPVPPSNGDQEVTMVSQDLPADGKEGTERRFGNRILSFEAKADGAGRVPFRVTYRVTRNEVKGESVKAMEDDLAALERFLRADAMVPVGGKPLELIKGRELPRDQTEAARVLYDVVNGHMRYSKEGTGWGRGDAVWACDSRFGNCSDFHSLFISLARARNIPAKFEIGFPLPEKRGEGSVAGYHCWAKFRPEGKGWVPVDISEANKNPRLRDYYFGNLTEDRVCFSTGRDLQLAPRQDGPPLNFFVYPYAEVGGRPYPQEKIDKQFSFKDER